MTPSHMVMLSSGLKNKNYSFQIHVMCQSCCSSLKLISKVVGFFFANIKSCSCSFVKFTQKEIYIYIYMMPYKVVLHKLS
jgi:hypothetical protein